MIVEKNFLEKKLEDLLKKFGNNIEILAKDLTDAILFLNIYCSEEKIKCEEIELEVINFQTPKILKTNYTKDGQKLKTKKESVQQGVKYIAQSYDKVITLTIIMSKTYLYIEKKYDTSTNYYSCEYIFDGKLSFVRNAKQNSCPLGKSLEFNETSKGNLNRGVCLSKITENSQEMEVNVFKILTKKGEEMYYSYFSKPDLFFMFRAPKNITTIPSITSIGMKALNELLEKQFDESFVRIEDEKIFNNLQKIAQQLFEKLNVKNNIKKENK